MRIAEQIVARGTNIYRTASTERDVFVLAAVTAPGDSGGPVVDADGQVVGVLFAFDIEPRHHRVRAHRHRARRRARPGARTAPTPPPIGTGPCLDE